MNQFFKRLGVQNKTPNRLAKTPNPLVILLFSLLSISTVNAFADTATSCGGGGAAIFNVFDGGKVEISNGSPSQEICNVSFNGSTNVNVTSGLFDAPQKSDDTHPYQCGLTPTDKTLDRLTLPPLKPSDSLTDVNITNNGSQIKIGTNQYALKDQSTPSAFRWCSDPDTNNKCNNNENGQKVYIEDQATGIVFPTASDPNFYINNSTQDQYKYDQVQVDNASLTFKYTPNTPFEVNDLDATNSAVITFEPGDYYFGRVQFADRTIVNVAGTGDGSGQARIYIENSGGDSTFIGNGSCINWPGIQTKDQCLNKPSTVPGNITNYPDNSKKLALYFYTNQNDRLEFGDQALMSGAVYANEGLVTIKGNSGTAFAGEMLAGNIKLGNNSNVNMYYQDTGVFSSLYSNTGTLFAFTGEYSKAPAAVPKVSQTGDLAFIPSQIEPDGTNTNYGGYLRAFALKADGTTDTTPTWSIGDYSVLSLDPVFKTLNRTLLLYTSSSSGGKELVATAGLSDASAFSDGTSLFSGILNSVTNIPAAMTASLISILGPNLSSRLTYATALATGLLNGTVPAVSDLPSDATNTLVNFLNGGWDTVIGLPNETKPLIYKDMVLFTTSDGYLYAADRKTGALQWGWIPRVFLPNLNPDKYENFLHSDPMMGQLSATVTSGALEDIQSDNTTNPKTGLVFGTAKGGAIHYGINIDADGSLGNVAWMDQRDASNTTASGYGDLTGTSPNAAAPTVFNNGTQVLYVVNNNLVIRPSAGGNASYDAQPNLGGNVITSTPFISSAGDLYVGDNLGFIWVASSIASGSNPSFTKLSTDSINGTTTGTADDAVRYLGIVPMPDATYLFAQSDTRLTVFKKINGATDWKKAWTSTVGASTLWDENGSVVEPTSTTDKTKYIQTLPAGAQITAASNVTGGVIFLPVSTEDPVTCEPQGSLYAFNIENGFFPPNSLYGAYYFGSQLTDNITLGTGIALAPQLSVLNGGLYVEGQSQQNAADANGNVAGGLDNPIELKGGAALIGKGDWRELVGQ